MHTNIKTFIHIKTKIYIIYILNKYEIKMKSNINTKVDITPDTTQYHYHLLPWWRSISTYIKMYNI